MKTANQQLHTTTAHLYNNSIKKITFVYQAYSKNNTHTSLILNIKLEMHMDKGIIVNISCTGEGPVKDR